MLQTDKDPQIDEDVWRAWLEKNKAQDKFTFAKRLKVMGGVAVFLTLSVLLWRVIS